MNMMQIIQGTTPTIVATVKSDIELSTVTELWFYISQSNRVIVDKTLEDVTIDTEEKTISCTLTQQDTLNLKPGDALLQIRVFLNDEQALATVATKITVIKAYKGGVISE